jgi:hypothetical protein
MPLDRDVWVLAGQSNMEGRSELACALPPDEGIFCFTSAGYWEQAREPMHRLWESYTQSHIIINRRYQAPEEADKTEAELAEIELRERTRHTGPGMFFAKVMADATGREIGLIAAAHGGMSLDEWSHKEKGTDRLYGAMLDRIDRAGGNPKGILWYQGESDAGPDTASTYLERFTAWIEEVRKDTGIPDLPVLVVQLGRYAVRSWPEGMWDLTRKALYELPDKVPYTACVTAVDLGLLDAIHINASGARRLGERLARVALDMERNPGAVPGVRVRKVCKADKSYMPLAGEVVKVVCSGVEGSWTPEENITGFDAYQSDGKTPAETCVYAAFPCPDQPGAIIVALSQPLTGGEILTYAKGINTWCNAVDRADNALCAFEIGIEES